jgi:hypothetical protein
MKALITSLFILLALSSMGQKSAEVEWISPVIGGNNGFFGQHRFFSPKLMTMLETSIGKGDKWDSIAMEIQLVDIIVSKTEERYITNYSETYSVVIFKNITETTADIFFYYGTFKTQAEATSYNAPLDNFHKCYTKEAYEIEMNKPVIPALSKDEVKQFLSYCKARIDKATSHLDPSDKKGRQTAIWQNMMAAPIKYAEEKGYNPFKSIVQIQKSLKEFEQDEEIKNMIQSINK